MLKVLLVDDDFQIIKLLEEMIDWSENDLEFVGAAGDGKDALEKIKKMRPDIVVSDIVMPGMDGIDLIRCVKEEVYSAKFIVLSFHSEHNYVKEAMKLGALEYLIKDELNPFVLKSSFDYAASIIKKERVKEDEINNKREILAKSHYMLVQQAVRKLIKGYYKDNKEREQDFIRLNIDFPCGAMVVAAIQLDKTPAFGNISNDDFKMEGFLILDYADQILNKEGSALFCKVETDHYVCIISFKEMKSEIYRHNKLFTDFSSIIKGIKTDHDISVSVGISDICGSFEDIPQCYLKSMNVLKTKKFFRPGKILFHDFYNLPEDSGLRTEIKNNISRIHKEIAGQLDIQKIKKILEEISQYFKYDRLSVETASQLVLEISVAFLLLERKVNDQLSLKHQESSLADGLVQYGDFFEDFFQILYQKLNKYEAGINSFCIFGKEQRWEIKETINYIRKNYDKKISLDEIAEKVQMSKPYLSKIFKKETGINIEDYLLQIRINISEDLLRNTNLKIYEIAVNLGFCSTQHFSNAFRKVHNLTPESFRTSSNKK